MLKVIERTVFSPQSRLSRGHGPTNPWTPASTCSKHDPQDLTLYFQAPLIPITTSLIDIAAHGETVHHGF